MYGKYRLLNVNHNAKTRKGDGQHTGYLTGVLYLAPSDTSGRYNVCQYATVGCKLACLNTAGRGGMNSVQKARIRKTQRFFQDRAAFLGEIEHDIRTLVRNAAKHGLRPAVRLNGTSDLPWESMGIMNKFPDVQFYDYTKNFHRMVDFLAGGLPQNYHLTFSHSEVNDAECKVVLDHGGTVAVIFETVPVDSYVYMRNNRMERVAYQWTDGDGNDLRFLDPKGTIIALKPKGRAKRDTTGFVVRKVA